MASLESQLQRLILSAEDLSFLNPQWKPQMIEDYLNILTDIITLANAIDVGQEDIDQIEADLAALTIRVAVLESDLANLTIRVTALEGDALATSERVKTNEVLLWLSM